MLKRVIGGEGEEMKTEEEIAKFRVDVLEQLATANTDNVKFLQGIVYALDWIKRDKEEDDG